MSLISGILGISVIAFMLFVIYCHKKKYSLDFNRGGYFAYGMISFISGLSLLGCILIYAVSPSILKSWFGIDLSGITDFFIPIFIGGIMSTISGLNNLKKTTKKTLSKD